MTFLKVNRHLSLILSVYLVGINALVPAQLIETTETGGKRYEPTRWEDAIVKIEAKHAEQRAEFTEKPLVVIGSSSARGWKLDKFFPGEQALNAGFGGSTIADATPYLDRLIFANDPRAIVLYSGDNDIAHKLTAEEVFGDFETFMDKIRDELPEVPVFVISIKPSKSRWHLAPEMAKCNELIKEEAEATDDLFFINIWDEMLNEDGEPNEELLLNDGLHMKPAGYAIWTEKTKAALADEGLLLNEDDEPVNAPTE